jgi:hypothetical protein
MNDSQGGAWMTLLLMGMAALALMFNTPEPPSPEAVAAAERRLADRAWLEPEPVKDRDGNFSHSGVTRR